MPYYLWGGLGTLVTIFDEQETGQSSVSRIIQPLAEVPIRQGSTGKSVTRHPRVLSALQREPLGGTIPPSVHRENRRR